MFNSNQSRILWIIVIFYNIPFFPYAINNFKIFYNLSLFINTSHRKFIILNLSLISSSLTNTISLRDPDKHISADPLVWPVHIQFEWYFPFLYAILQSIPIKFVFRILSISYNTYIYNLYSTICDKY